MTNHETNVKIAEILGWQQDKAGVWFRPDGTRPPLLGDPNDSLSGRFRVLSDEEIIPDYCNDLNLMHEAEKGLTDTQGGNYDSMLWIIIQRDKSRPASWHATAEQRAEAFLKTIAHEDVEQPEREPCRICGERPCHQDFDHCGHDDCVPF